ncbi:aspartate aminotransferase family protein [bacterium SCSIO 12741]|nr:aspartate aminotransferase family protein [bacterium SCSIO 12741]
MYAYWKKLSQETLRNRVFEGLKQNVNYSEENILGIPASFLDSKVFSQDEFFLKDAPFISTLVQNPNHIGCHTLEASENYFSGTQAIEQELIELCAIDILQAEPNSVDGYVASGGTEANIQALWIYRNYFLRESKADPKEIAILCSTDSHYSMNKGGNLLSLDLIQVQPDDETRLITREGLRAALKSAQAQGKSKFIVVCNMMTTMFGSVDPVDLYVEELEAIGAEFKIHVDGAFGGFYYPFSHESSSLTFAHPHITSFTLDAHKMAQAPYGTGIFLVRKNHMNYANTQASYVHGDDCTLIGSRSGANAIAVWMILMKNGPFGWKEKIFLLQKRTEWMSKQLDELQVSYYRNPYSNIITIRQEYVPADIAHKFGLVPDNHADPKWFKIVIMEHVTIEKLIPLVEDLKTILPVPS